MADDRHDAPSASGRSALTLGQDGPVLASSRTVGLGHGVKQTVGPAPAGDLLGAVAKARLKRPLTDHHAERMPRGVPVEAPGNRLAAGTRPRGEVLGGEHRARCYDSVMSGSLVSYKDVEGRDGA
jgi:hypothetical protein